MRLTNRELKKAARETHEKILKEDSEWYANIRAQRYGNKATQKTSFLKMSKKAVLGITSCLLITIAIAISLLVVLLPEDSDTPKRYFGENEASKISDLSSVNKDLISTILLLNSSTITSVDLFYDLPTNDTLYYAISINDEDNLISAKLFVVVNEDFNRPLQEIQEKHDIGEANGFRVDYEKTATDIDGLFSIECRAMLTTENEIYFIEYIGWSIDEEGTFLEWLEQTIIAK